MARTRRTTSKTNAPSISRRTVEGRAPAGDLPRPKRSVRKPTPPYTPAPPRLKKTRSGRTPTGSTYTPPKNRRTIGQILDTHPLVKGVKSAAKFVGQVPLIEPIGVGRVLANRRKKAAEERAKEGRAVSKLGDENRAMARSLKKLDAANLARANEAAKDKAAKKASKKAAKDNVPKKPRREGPGSMAAERRAKEIRRSRGSAWERGL